MAGEGSRAIIGSVSIKVLPDTDDFRKVAQAKLRGIEKSLKDIKIGFEAKTTEAVAEAKKAKAAAVAATEKPIRVRFDFDDPKEVARALRKVEGALDDFKDRIDHTFDGNNYADLIEGAEELKARLDEISTVDLKVDYSDTASMARAKARIQAEIDKFDEIDLSVHMDRESLEETRDELQRFIESEELILKNIEIDRDNRLFGFMRERVSAQVEEAFDSVAAFKPEVDTDNFTRTLDRLYMQMEEARLKITPDLSDREKHQLKEEIEDIEAKIQVHLDEATQRYTQLRLSFMGRTRIVRFVPVVDAAAAAKVGAILAGITGGRLFTDFFTGIKNFLTDLDKAVPKLFILSNVFANLTGWLLAATSNMFAFGGSLAQIGGAGLALPGILGGMAIGIGVTVAALKDFNEVFPQAEKALSRLQDNISANFWAEAAKPFREFADTIFPQFSKGATQAATALGNFFGNFATSLKGAFNNQMAGMFDDLAESIRISGKYTDDFAGIIQKLGEVGAGYLPNLAKWFGDISRQFNQWLEAKGTSGLEEFIDTGIDRLKDLGSVLADTGRTLSGFYKAAEAGGGATLDILADTMERVADTVNGNAFQMNMTNVFAAAHKGMSNISNISGPAFTSLMERVADLLTDVLPTAGRTLGKALDAIFSALDQPQVQGAIENLFRSTEQAVENLAPMMPSLADALSKVVNAMAFLGRTTSAVVAPAFQTLYGMVKPFAEVIGAIPGPVKTLVVQLGLLGFAAIKLNAALVASKTAMVAFATSARTAGTGVTLLQTRMGKAAGIAGIAGMGASMAATKVESDGMSKSLSVLGSVGTGAAMGAMVGSVFPGLGTAIGTAAGAAVGLGAGLAGIADGSRNAKPPVDALKDSTANYAATLDSVTTKITQQTRAEAQQQLQKAGLAGAYQQLGVSQRTMIDAAMGNEAATKRLNQAYRGSTEIIDQLMGRKLARWAREQGVALGKQRNQMQNNIVATGTYKDLLARLPKNIRTKIQQLGAKPTQKEIDQVRKAANKLTGLKRKIVLELLGQKKVNDGINGVKKNARSVGKMPGSLDEWLNGVSRDARGGEKAAKGAARGMNKHLRGAGRTKSGMDHFVGDVRKRAGEADNHAKRGANNISNSLKNGTAKAQANLAPFTGSLTSAISGAQSIASSGGAGVGNNLGAGVNGSLSGWADPIISRARSIVAGAVAAMKAAAKIFSPSRETAYIGNMMGEGLIRSLRSYEQPVAAVSGNIISKKSLKTLRKNVKQFRKWVKALSKDGSPRFDRFVKRMHENFKKLVSSFDSALKKYKRLQKTAREFANTVAETVKQSASPVGQDIQTFDGMRAYYQKTLFEAQRFTTVMQDLMKKGLNKTTLNQLLTAGPEAALAQAEAILEGGRAGVQEINKMQSEINKAGDALGTSAANEFYGPQLDRLEKKLTKLRNRIRNINNRMLKQFRKAADRNVPQVTKQFENLNRQVNQTLRQMNRLNKATAASGLKKGGGGGTTNNNQTTVVHYYAAENKSFNSEQELYAALSRV